jgi:hypothetical protein
VESYGLPFHRGLLGEAGVRTVPLPVDEHGARIGELGTAGTLGAVLLTPAHQFPTGGPLHPERRAAVVDWARSTDGLVLEDDYDGEFRYDRRPVDPTPWQLRRTPGQHTKEPRSASSERGPLLSGQLQNDDFTAVTMSATWSPVRLGTVPPSNRALALLWTVAASLPPVMSRQTFRARSTARPSLATRACVMS